MTQQRNVLLAVLAVAAIGESFVQGDTLQPAFHVRFAAGSDGAMELRVQFSVKVDSIRSDSGEFVEIHSDSARTLLGAKGTIENQETVGRYVKIPR